MSSRWSFVWKSPALSVIALLLFGSVPLASAQYVIPDCFVATVNGMFPDEVYAAARDQMYREMNGEWSSNIAGMSAAQVTAYIPAFCASLVVNDLGETDGTQHLEYGYLPGETWLAENGGSASGGTSSGNSGTTGNTGTTGTINSNSSGTSGATIITSGSSGGNAASALLGGSSTATTNSTTQAQTSSAAILFETDFDTMPRELEILESDSGLIDGTVMSSDRESFLTMKATEPQSLQVTTGADFTDYSFEARIRVMAGTFTMTARVGESFCTGYDFGTDPTSAFVTLRRTNEDCEPTELASLENASIGLDDWFTYRLEVNGTQITAFIDGDEVLSATDANYAQGYPIIFIFPNDEDEALIDIDYIRVSEPGSASVSASSLPQTISFYDAPHSQVITELVALGLVPDGGTFIFKEPFVSAGGDEAGLWFTSLATSAPHANIVMSGELLPTFAADGEYEDCTLMARVNMDDDLAESELNVGVDSDGDATTFDLISLDEEGMSDITPLSTPLTEPQHILMILMGSELTVYINGELVFDRIAVEERSGVYGIGLSSESADSLCEGTDVWVYSFD